MARLSPPDSSSGEGGATHAAGGRASDLGETPKSPTGKVPALDTGRFLGVTDEWKEARNVVDTTDAQLASLRQYGFTIVSGILAAQGLIESPLAGSTTVVPYWVRLFVVLATLLLIMGIFDLDLRTRLIQRAAASRAMTLEKDTGLTHYISDAWKPHEQLTSADLTYMLFVGVTAGLGAAINVAPPNPFNLSAVGVLTLLLILASVLVFLIFHWSKAVRGTVTGTSNPPATGWE